MFEIMFAMISLYPVIACCCLNIIELHVSVQDVCDVETFKMFNLFKL